MLQIQIARGLTLLRFENRKPNPPLACTPQIANPHAAIAEIGLPPFNPPRGVLGPFAPKVGNGVKHELPGPSGPGAQKVENRVEKESESGIFNSFSTFLTLLQLSF